VQPHSTASPDELPCRQSTLRFRSRALLFIAVLLAAALHAGSAFALQKNAAGSAAASCEVVKPQPVKTTSKAAAKPRPPSAKRKAKAKPKPVFSEATKAKATSITSELSPALPEGMEDEISKFFGLRYRLGGDGNGGIDCSALVQKVYSDVFGVDLPRSSSQQSRLDNLDSVTEHELRTGDLLFFGPQRKRVNHVGMYLAGGYFLHAARSEGVTISRLDEGYWKSRWMFSKRVRGLELEYDTGEDQELEDLLHRYSAGLSFAGAGGGDMVSFVEGGIRLNDSLEFLLSGFFLNALDDSQPLPEPGPAEAIQPAELSETETGFRLSAILSPLEWFKLIPSVTQVDGQKDAKNQDANYQKLGLETWMFLPSSRAAVFMGAFAKNQDDIFERPLGVSPDWQAMDISLGLHYRLSDSLRFSLWGTHAYSPDARYSDDSGRGSLPVDDVSFQLNIKF
jgi:cell wall-associated NlpC family hydrolase